MFKQNVIQSFQKVKTDMNLLKKNLGDWLRYLELKQQRTEQEVHQLRQQVKKLEKMLMYAQ